MRAARAKDLHPSISLALSCDAITTRRTNRAETTTAEGQRDFASVPQTIRDPAAASLARGRKYISSTQIRSHEVLAASTQQDDPLTLQPDSGRNFEPPAERASESVDVLLLLTNNLPHPNDAEQQSIRAAAT